MNIGFSSITAAYNPLDCVFELEDVGFSAWEIVCEGEMAMNKRLQKKIVSIKESTNLEITIHAPFSDLNLASVNQPIWKESLKQIKSCIELSFGLTNIVTVHMGHLSPIGSQIPEKAWNQMITALQKICDLADDLGIVIAVENMINIPWLFGRYPHEFTNILEKVGKDNIGITLDIGHANLMGLIDEFLNIEFIHVHAHDNFGESDEHLPIGQGLIDWKNVVKGLKDYKGIIINEAKSFEDGKESYNYLTSLNEV